MNQSLVKSERYTASGVIVVGFIYYFKSVMVLWIPSINIVKYMACGGQIFYSVFNAHPPNLIKVIVYQVCSV